MMVDGTVYFNKDKVDRTFQKGSINRQFIRGKANTGAIHAVNPIDPTIDPRLTRIPVLLAPGLLFRVNVQSSAYFQWLYPDGSYVRNGAGSYTISAGERAQYAYIVMDDGHTVDELTSFEDIIGGVTAAEAQWETSDLFYIRPTAYLALGYIAQVRGDVKYLAGAVQNVVNAIYLLGERGYWCLHGDLSSWPKLKVYALRLSSHRDLCGSLDFIAGAITVAVNLAGCMSLGPADISQTIVNYDACNANAFSRTFIANSVKRSQLTAAGEAAVVSLIAKGCSFTFKAE